METEDHLIRGYDEEYDTSENVCQASRRMAMLGDSNWKPE